MNTNASSSSSFSAERIEGCEDLLTEILVRVPAKPLLHFKLVSKRWHSLLSAPHFYRRHIHRQGGSAKPSGVFLQPQSSSNLSLNLFTFDKRNHHSSSPFQNSSNRDDYHNMSITQSCNGLLLGSFQYSPHRSKLHYFLCNPTTKAFTLLPHPSIHRSEKMRMSLAFDPSRSPNYTVVCLWRVPHSSRFGSMVYSSSSAESPTPTWRSSASSFSAPWDMNYDHGVYFNGAVHWICWRKRASLCFDVGEERMRDIMPPLPRPDQCYVAAPACGHLNLVGMFFSKVSVFRLENDYSRWVLMHTLAIQYTPLPIAFPHMVHPSSGLGIAPPPKPAIDGGGDGFDVTQFYHIHYEYNVLHLLEDDREDGESNLSLLLQIPGNVLVLHLKDNTFHEFLDMGSRGDPLPTILDEAWYKAYEYVESLVSV